jgi:hypothetical protein
MKWQLMMFHHIPHHPRYPYWTRAMMITRRRYHHHLSSCECSSYVSCYCRVFWGLLLLLLPLGRPVIPCHSIGRSLTCCDSMCHVGLHSSPTGRQGHRYNICQILPRLAPLFYLYCCRYSKMPVRRFLYSSVATT